MTRAAALLVATAVLVATSMLSACGTAAGGDDGATVFTNEAPGTTTSAEAVSTTEATTTAAPRASVTIGIAGDTTFTDGLDQADPLGQVADLLTSYDLMVVNLETAVADPGVGSPPVQKRFLFRSPPASLDLLVDAGVDAVTLGNNHFLDFGVDAVAQTLAELDARAILHVGGGLDEASAYAPLEIDVEGWRVAIHSFSRVPCDWSWAGENVRPQVAWACDPFLEVADAAIVEARARNDVSIVVVHGGAEGELCPSDFMVELHRRWAGLGVDVVVGGHPHVVQGVASFDGMPVALSVGNFAFPPARGITANSVVAEITVSEGIDGEADVVLSLEPVRADGGVVRPADDAQRAAIVAQIDGHSTGWRLDADGVVVADPDHVGVC